VPNLALIALGDSHHSQGGMKFATQISPLLNSILVKPNIMLSKVFKIYSNSVKPIVNKTGCNQSCFTLLCHCDILMRKTTLPFAQRIKREM
jgi:hypothetical protein